MRWREARIESRRWRDARAASERLRESFWCSDCELVSVSPGVTDAKLAGAGSCATADGCTGNGSTLPPMRDADAHNALSVTSRSMIYS